MLAHRFSPAAIELLGKDAKVAILATVDPIGLPHLTLITSLAARGPEQLMFGQFCEGRSKAHVRAHPRVGFFALDADRRWLRGKAIWRCSVRAGEDFESYNKKPMFRYNAYFGVHTVHHLDVVEIEEGGRLRVSRLLGGAALAHTVRVAVVASDGTPALTPWGASLLSGATTLKFASYVGEDGHPRIIPGVATCAAGAGRLVAAIPGDDPATAQLADDVPLAVFALDREMRSVLVRGRLTSRRRLVGSNVAALDIDWVYNSMPPKHGQIFPPVCV